MGPGIALKGFSYLRYPIRETGIHTLPWTVGGRRTLWSQVLLTFPPISAAKKHDIPQAIFFAKSVYFKPALGSRPLLYDCALATV
jgi:hypothetical protein